MGLKWRTTGGDLNTVDDSCCRMNKTKDKELREGIGVMNEIKTVEQAVGKAEAFIIRYYAFHRLESVKKSADTWIVRFDVSVVGPKRIVTIRIDKNTGDVIEYTSAE